VNTKPCDCTKIEILSSNVITDCHSLLESARSQLGFPHWEPRFQSVIHAHGLFGTALGLSDRANTDLKAVLVAVPKVFGIFVSRIELNEAKFQQEFSIDFKAALHISVPQLEKLQMIASADVQLDGFLRDPANLKVTTKDVKGGDDSTKKSYDWKCLAKCAPSCLTCFDNIHCWLVCAGACVISCAIE
jgi:hypothetical protein